MKMNTNIMVLLDAKGYPKLRLPQHLLLDAGFSKDTLAVCTAKDDMLEIKAVGEGLTAYESIVTSVIKNAQHLARVKCERFPKVLHLTVFGGFLSANGFKKHDVLLVRYEKGLIVLKRIDLAKLGFDEDNEMKSRVFAVQKSTREEKVRPRLELNGKWLADIGFKIRTPIHISHEKDTLIFEANIQSNITYSQDYYQKPRQTRMKVGKRGNNLKNPPAFLVHGRYLKEKGFDVGDILIARYKQGIIILKRLDLDKFGF